MADLAPLSQPQLQPGLGRGLFDTISRLAPGLLLAALVTFGAGAIERQFGGPIMLYALVAGMFVAPLAGRAPFNTGIDYAAKEVLKFGIILLGARVTVAELATLGWQTAVTVVFAVAMTISVGWWIGRKLKLSSSHAVISAGAVAICGASAALAICAVLPKEKKCEQNTVITVLSVTALSTLAMVFYPVITTMLGYDSTQAGVFMGMTIHNVAQVIGAGYMVSGEAAETATIVKLMRIACLVPAVIAVSIVFSKSKECLPSTKKPPLLPLFLIGFVLVMAVNSLGLLPAPTAAGMGTASHWALVMSVAALGAKTPFQEMLKVGPRSFAAMGLQTAFLAVFAIVTISAILTF